MPLSSIRHDRFGGDEQGGSRSAENRMSAVAAQSLRRLEKFGDGAPIHQVSSNEPCEGERACNDPVGIVGQAQQQEDDQRDRDLNPDGIFRCSEEVADLQGLLDPSKEQLDRPSTLVEVGDILRAGLQVIGEDAQHLAALVDDAALHAPARPSGYGGRPRAAWEGSRFDRSGPMSPAAPGDPPPLQRAYWT